MSSIWGNNIQISLFGESHGKGVGATINGLPPGIKIDEAKIKIEMQRRAPGGSKSESGLTTKRDEKDEYTILSGILDGVTTGAPLTCFIENTGAHSNDYPKNSYIPRPSHADYTANIKYDGYADMRGGGHFSGRLTAPLVFMGAIAKQILQVNHIFCVSHILNIGGILDKKFDFDTGYLIPDLIATLSNKEICTLDDYSGERMKKEIQKAKEEGDSLGGILETAIFNVPECLGSPFFDSFESRLSQIVFSIPAVKGIEFGAGFSFANMRGSQANDPFAIEENTFVYTTKNNNGGILGGITTGMPVTFNTVFKPTPSIAIEQNTVNLNTKENTKIKIEGRHDPCIVLRAVPVLEAVTALVTLDFILDKTHLHSC